MIGHTRLGINRDSVQGKGFYGFLYTLGRGLQQLLNAATDRVSDHSDQSELKARSAYEVGS